MINQAVEEHSGDPRQPKLPLIRLRVDYSDEYLTLSSNHFGQRFVGRVANPKDLILFKCKKVIHYSKPVKDSNLEMIDEMYENEESSKHCHIDDVINEYFENVEPSSQLSLLAEKKLTNAVKDIVEKDPQSSKIQVIIDWHINAVKEHLFKKGENLDKILSDKTLVKEIMQDFKDELRKKEEAENKNLINFEELEGQYKKKPAKQQPKADDDDEFDDDLDLDEHSPPPKKAAGRGKAKTPASKPATRGRGASARGRG